MHNSAAVPTGVAIPVDPDIQSSRSTSNVRPRTIMSAGFATGQDSTAVAKEAFDGWQIDCPDRRGQSSETSNGVLCWNQRPILRQSRFPAILSDDVSLRRISCPIVFLCPANDDHGCISELDLTVLRQAKWRDHLPGDSRPNVSRKAGGRFLQPAWRQAGNNGGSRKHDVSVVPPFQGN